MIDGEVSARTVQDWLGARYPKIADACDRIQGIGDVFADIVIAIDSHSSETGRDVATFRPVARIEGSSVRIDLY